MGSFRVLGRSGRFMGLIWTYTHLAGLGENPIKSVIMNFDEFWKFLVLFFVAIKCHHVVTTNCIESDEI